MASTEMAPTETPARPKRVRKPKIVLRQFVVRLESPGVYDKLRDEAFRRSKREGRRVPMTEIVRDAIIQHLG